MASSTARVITRCAVRRKTVPTRHDEGCGAKPPAPHGINLVPGPRPPWGAQRPVGIGFGSPGGVGCVAPALPVGREDGAGAGATPTAVPAVTVTVALPATPFTVAVIVAVPGALPVTFPLASTVATLSSLDFHVALVVMSCAVLFEKVAIAVNCAPSPTLTLLLLATVTVVTVAGPTAMLLAAPAMLALLVSVAVSVWVPGVLKVTVTVFTPLSAAMNVVSGGKIACGSLLVKWTVPV
jgi:hypothetical protein